MSDNTFPGQDVPEQGLEATAEKPKMRWYVVQAFSNYEKRVKLTLEEAIGRLGMEDYFGEILVPTEEVVEMKAGQKRTSERKFYPGYVLVQMVMNDESWHLVKSTPRVSGFIGGKASDPTPLTDKEAMEILQRVQDGTDAINFLSSLVSWCELLKARLQISMVRLKMLTTRNRSCVWRYLFLVDLLPSN